MSFLEDRIVMEGLTFDDVLLVPAYSEVLPREVHLEGRFSRHISLRIPVVSAAMDTVTEAPMAIALSRAGGIGVLHKNMSPAAQAAEVRRVKEAPVTDSSCVDGSGRLCVAAGVGITPDALARVQALVEAGVDAVVLDSAHGHSKGVIDKLCEIKVAFPQLDVVVGNIATAEAAIALAEAGADAIKVGIGPGSICTTRIVAGVGVPQLTAIYECAKAVKPYGIPVIADGGLRYSGDVVKALAAGGDCVMCGSMLSGTDEAPGEILEAEGLKFKTYRGMGSVEAMKAGSKDRYFQGGETETKKLVPEGVVGRTTYKGPVADVLYQIIGGLRSGMGYCGVRTLEDLHKARFIRISPSGMAESHPHDITITETSPNYQ